MTSTVATDPVARHDKYVAFIREVCRTPGSRAALRSGLRRRPEHAHRMHAFLAEWVPERAHPDQERAYYTVAALMAAQPSERGEKDAETAVPEPKAAGEEPKTEPRPARRRNLGHSLADAVNGDSARGKAPAKRTTMEKRLQLLARQGVDGVHSHLPALMDYLRTKEVPVEWSQLLEDLRRWPFDRHQIAKQWLQAYYRTINDPDQADTDNTEE